MDSAFSHGRDDTAFTLMTGAFEIAGPGPGVSVASEWVRAAFCAPELDLGDRLLCEAGLAKADLCPGTRLPVQTMVTLFRSAAKIRGDADIGLHLGEVLVPRSLGLLGYIIENSHSMREAFGRSSRYSRLADTGGFGVVMDGSRVWIRFGTGHSRAPAEMFASCTVAIVRHLTGRDHQPLAVQFEHEQPKDLSEHERIFGLAPVFRCGEPGLAFDAKLLDIQLEQADPQLAHYLEHLADEVLQTLAPTASVESEVRRELACVIRTGESLGVDAISRRLGMSSRTLHRRLKDEGTSYRVISQCVRLDRAKRLLGQEGATMAEVAFMSGFSDASTFSRAFHQWAGEPPSAYALRARGQLPGPAAPSNREPLGGPNASGQPGTTVHSTDFGDGGGGAGRIRINNSDRSNGQLTGVLSPAWTTPCATVGKDKTK
jgi:AraC-like DNA-binding protein